MLKEIVTKAVVSKGKIADNSEMQFEIEDSINKVIGCWIINHNYLSIVDTEKLYASGFYDVHVWYAINNSSDTKILKKTIEYRDEFVLDNSKFDYDSSEYKIYCIEYPTCTNLSLNGNRILVNIKKSLAIDVIGESKLLVQVSDGYYKEDETMGINPNYMNK